MLADYRTASIDEPLRATLGLLERVTLTPDEVTEADAASVRAAGVSDAAIVEALHVCYVFNIYDRLADAFDFHVPTEEGFRSAARVLLSRGYMVPRFLLR